MRHIYLPLFAAMVLMSGSLAAQNTPPTFNEIYDTITIIEGELIAWFISVSDPDPGDLISMYVIPSTDDPIYKSYLTFERFDDTTYYFRFIPFYDLIEGGETDLPLTIYATDQSDTVSMPITITVLDNNPAPKLDDLPGSFRIAEGVLFTLLVSASDPDLTFPALETSPLPANAEFVDSLNGRGLFSFLPDETQYGDSALDYNITFYARDPVTDSSHSKTVIITVSGPNAPPVLDIIETQTVTEGDTLILTVTAADPNGTIPELSADSLPPNSEFVDNRDGTGTFTFTPDFLQAGFYTVIFMAGDGKSTDTLPVLIAVAEAGNQPPVFAPLPDTSFREGAGTLEILIIATDPEGGRVTLFWQDSVANMTFDKETYSQDTGLFAFTPSLDQGGSYRVKFIAMDDHPEDPGFDSVTLNIEITEFDQPPTLIVSPSGAQNVREGERLRLKWRAYDDYEENLRVNIFPPPDSAVFKGDMTMIRYTGNGFNDSLYVDSGYLEFAPDYNFLQGRNDTVIILKFSVGDSYDTVRQERVITVYDVKPDNRDPGLPDTVIMMSAVWDDSLPGFKLRTRIWNDSAVAAGMTGFRWYYPWLRCDTIIFDTGHFNENRLKDSLYLKYYIYNDSMMFLTSFIFFDSLFLDSGYSEYFTAYFKYDPDVIDIDTIPYVRFDTAKVGSAGEFFLDKRLRGAPPLKVSDDDLLLFVKSPYTYKPMVQKGDIRAPGNRVRMEIFDVGKGIALGKGSLLCARDAQYEPKQYEIRLLVENAEKLADMSLGFSVSNESNDVVWSYHDPVISIIPVSRMYPDADIWSASSGLQLSAHSMNGQAADSFRIFGNAVPGNGGLPPGLVEYMIRIPFAIVDVTGESATLCFDSSSVGAWLFTDTSGQPAMPLFDGGLCLKVQYTPTIVTDRVKLEIHDLGAAITLGDGDSLYVRDAADQPKQYELRLQLENTKQLSGISLDFAIYSENQDVLWTYGETLFTVDTLSRMYPDSAVWSASSGLIFSQYGMDGAAADSFRIAGTAATDSGGLTPGPLTTMIRIPFAISDVIGQAGRLCFDSGAVETPAGWSYTDTSGLSTSPLFTGRRCFPVFYDPVTSVDDNRPPLPLVYQLDQNYPNPFNPATTIRFSLTRRDHVKITIFNILGQIVATLTDQYYDPGIHDVVWDGLDSRGHSAASGIYLYHFASEGLTTTRKMILLR